MAAGGKPSFSHFTVDEDEFVVDSKYTLTKLMGKGAYGLVCGAVDSVSGQEVAIKKICSVFGHPQLTLRTIREIKLLRHFQHENIISIREIMKPRSPDFNELYMVNDLLDTDLHKLITSPQPFTNDHCMYFLYQILRAIKYVHSAGVLHRDLKPGNILLNANCDLKLCDFGLSRCSRPIDNHAGFMTEYVITRWYRPPEILCSWREYTRAIDVWSIGCIFAEMLCRRPLFPGKDFLDQLKVITNIIGTPREEELAPIENPAAREFMMRLPFKPKVPWGDVLVGVDGQALDLLDKMLQFDPRKRISVMDALAHPYLASLHDPADEPVCSSEFSFEFERQATDMDSMRGMVLDEINFYHQQDPIDFSRPVGSMVDAHRLVSDGGSGAVAYEEDDMDEMW